MSMFGLLVFFPSNLLCFKIQQGSDIMCCFITGVCDMSGIHFLPFPLLLHILDATKL